MPTGGFGVVRGRREMEGQTEVRRSIKEYKGRTDSKSPTRPNGAVSVATLLL